MAHNREGVIGAIAYYQNTMVQGCSTGSLKDASSIQLELALVSLYGHRHWLIGHCLHSIPEMMEDTRSIGMLKHAQSAMYVQKWLQW